MLAGAIERRPEVKVAALRFGSPGGARVGYRLFTPLSIATFRCARPALCGALVGERRIAAGDAGGREMLIQSRG